MKVLIDLHYLPCLEYFAVLLQADIIIIEKHEHFVKQSYRNRCYINSANGVLKLVAPITEKRSNALMKDVRLDYSSKWFMNHWRAIQSAYGKAAFFEFYADGVYDILNKKYDFLYDLNTELLSFCLQSLTLSIALTESLSYEKVPADEIKDLRSVISPKIPYYERNFFLPVTYHQVFGNKFVNNLSFIDLLFCEGPNAIEILKSSTKGYLNN